MILPDNAYRALFYGYLRRSDRFHHASLCVMVAGVGLSLLWVPLVLLAVLVAGWLHARALRMIKHAEELADQRWEYIKRELER